MLNEVVGRCRSYIETNISEKLSAEIIAREIGYSPFYLTRIFKQVTGVSLMKFVTDRKLEKACEDILSGKKILDTAIHYGFSTHSAFSKCFKRRYGYPPAYLKFYQCQNEYFKGENSMSIIKEYTSKSTEELYGVLVDKIKKRFCNYELAQLEKAYTFAVENHYGESRYSGEPYINHSLNVALILADIEADPPAIIAGLLHDVSLEAGNTFIADEYGEAVRGLWQMVKEFHKESNISDFDTEAALIILADRLHNMRTIEFISKEKWEEKAKETIEFFCPLAELVNQTQLKTELDERSLTFLQQ